MNRRGPGLVMIAAVAALLSALVLCGFVVGFGVMAATGGWGLPEAGASVAAPVVIREPLHDDFSRLWGGPGEVWR